MSLSCLLGLTACLSFNGQQFTAEAAAGIRDQCYELVEAPLRSFATPAEPGPSMTVDDRVRYELAYFRGYSVGQTLERAGLPIDWKVIPAYRKASWLNSCALFDAAFNDKKRWTHLEKWPWK